MSSDNQKMRASASFSLTRRHTIPHYYGDHVRTLFVSAGVLSVVAIPLVGNLLPFGAFVQVGGALALVLLAGLANPHSVMLFLYNAIISGVGVLLLESAAISFYSPDFFLLFVAREAATLLLLFAFYFSVKTLRAMLLGKLGKLDRPWEFENTKDTVE